MGKKEYGVIVFDLGNTIIRFDHNISAAKIANLCRCDTKKIYDIFFDSDITRDFEKGLLSPREFYKRAADLLGIKVPYRDFVLIWNDIFWEDEGACDIAKSLKGSYRLFLLSNVNRLHFEHIQKKFAIIKIFDEMILSFMIGAIKPDRLIFEEAIRRAGGDKDEMLYIDDRQDLVAAAAGLGIDSIRYEGPDRLLCAMREKGVIV